MPLYLAPYYNYIYLLFVSILTFIALSKYKQQINGYAFNREDRGMTIIVVILCILFIGFRPQSGKYFVDMGWYIWDLETLYADGYFTFNCNTDNIIFDNLIAWWGARHIGTIPFFVFIAVIYFVTAYWGIKRLFPRNQLIAYLVFLAAFSTFSYGTNGIKSGAAASIFILALSYIEKPLICILFAALSFGFHHSMQVPIAALIIVFFVKNPKYYYYVWGGCLLMSILHITYFQGVFSGMTNEHGAGYLIIDKGSDSNSYIGFRPDFVLYSAVPIIFGYYFEIKKKIVSKIYASLIHYYITTNAVWLLCMYADFSNRFAYLSWFVYPIVLIYPFFDKANTDNNRYKTFCKVVKYHLFFTLFMVVLYYGLLNLHH